MIEALPPRTLMVPPPWPSPARWVFALLMVMPPAAIADWIRFRNETADRVLASPESSTADREQKSFAWGDVDGDGDIDLVCARKQPWAASGGRPNVLFLNEGRAEGHERDGVLVDRTFAFALAATDGGRGFHDLTNDKEIRLVDVDGDGWPDLVTSVTLGDGLPKRLSHPRIYRNLGRINGVWAGFVHEEFRIPFLRIGLGEPAAAPRFGSVAVGDVNRDGRPDLYFANDDAGPGVLTDLDDRLLINDGFGAFEDSFDSRVPASFRRSTRSGSAALVDMNSDGLPDIVKSESDPAYDFGVVISYQDARRPGQFLPAKGALDFAALGVSVGDLNQDGRPDMVVTEAGTDRLLMNMGNDSSGMAQFRSSYLYSDPWPDEGPGGESLIVDLDHDGLSDIIVTDADPEFAGCRRRTKVFRNLGASSSYSFEERRDLGFSLRGVHSLAVFDLNGDALNDIVAGTCSGLEIWMRNDLVGPRFVYPNGFPARLESNQSRPFRVRVLGDDGLALTPVSMHLFQGVGQTDFRATAMQSLGQGLFQGELPAIDCDTSLRWFLSANLNAGSTIYDPQDAGTDDHHFASPRVDPELLMFQDFQSGTSGWITENSAGDRGGWTWAVPRGTRHLNQDAAPPSDATRGAVANRAFVTENGPEDGLSSTADVDGGPHHLISPRLDLTEQDAFVVFRYWFFCDDLDGEQADFLAVELSNDGGATWNHVARLSPTDGSWETGSFRIGALAAPTASVFVRFSVADFPNDSVTEAGIDDFQVLVWDCSPATPSIIDSDPPTGAVDARQPTELDNGTPDGWSSIQITFNQALDELKGADFEITSFGGSKKAPSIESLLRIDEFRVLVTLVQPIEPGTWTELRYSIRPVPIKLGYLPGDVTANGKVDSADIESLIKALSEPETYVPAWSLDIDRSRMFGPSDLIRQLDLLNGADGFEIWNGRRLP